MNSIIQRDGFIQNKGKKKMVVQVGSLRFDVFAIFCHKHPKPVSNEDIYETLNYEHKDSVRPRVAELRRAGYIALIDRIKGKSGLKIQRWALTPSGVIEAQRLGAL